MTDFSEGKRNIGLDVLRSLAILLVMIEHGANLWIGLQLSVLNYIGIDGVSIFFVLSGFLIGRIILRLFDNTHSWNRIYRFLQRRWIRTLPNYFLILIILVCSSTFRQESISLIDALKYVVFLQNFLTPHPAFFPEAWSLSIEEWFYFIFPMSLFLLFTFLTYSKRMLTWFILIWILSVILFRANYFLHLPSDILSSYLWDESIRKIVLTRLDAPLYGVLFAVISTKAKSQFFTRIGLILLLFHLIIYSLCSFYDNWLYPSIFSFTLFSLSVSCLIPWFMNLKINSNLIRKVFTKTSQWSYSLYLVNLTLVQVTILANIPFHWFLQDGFYLYLLRYLFFWICSFSISFLLYEYFEKPVINYRNRVFPEI